MTLEELIPLYGQQNTEYNALKKKVNELNGKLKEAIKEQSKENQDIVMEGWKCKLTVEYKSDMNEERLLEFVKKYNIPVVKQKEYIDFDMLEDLIYKEQVPKDVVLEMNSCMDKNIKEVLRISKIKGKE